MGTQNIWNLFPEEMRELFKMAAKRQDKIQEIRLRVRSPVYVVEDGRERFLDWQGQFTDLPERAKLLTGDELKSVVNHICRYSLYAYEDEIRQGFLTVRGGHRVGIAGQAVLTDKDELRTIKHISGLNIRIAHEIKGAADRVIPYIYENGRLQNTLIISPPGCGKTTILRDLIRQVSDGNVYGQGIPVGVVDERSEIAGCYQGCPQNDVGIRTDVLDSCPKAKGMMLLVRSMAPGAIAIDELGAEEEWKALLYASYCGIALLATMHGAGLEDYRLRQKVSIPGQNDIFERCIVLRRKEQRCMIEEIHKKEERGNWQCIFQKS